MGLFGIDGERYDAQKMQASMSDKKVITFAWLAFIHKLTTSQMHFIYPIFLNFLDINKNNHNDNYQ